MYSGNKPSTSLSQARVNEKISLVNLIISEFYTILNSNVFCSPTIDSKASNIKNEICIAIENIKMRIGAVMGFFMTNIVKIVSNDRVELQIQSKIASPKIASQKINTSKTLPNTRRTITPDYGNVYFINMTYILGHIESIISKLKNFSEPLVESQCSEFDPKIFQNIDRKLIILKESIKDINISSNRIDYNKCECGLDMFVENEHSELQCRCGLIKKVSAVVTSDEYMAIDGQRTKSGAYEPSRHCRFWLERIQGIEAKDIPEDDQQQLRACFARDHINMAHLTCKKMRYYLKECGLTKYNENVALLMNMFSGRSSYRLTYMEKKATNQYFSKIHEIYDLLFKSNEYDKNNRPYYPYFLFKIFEHMFNKQPEKLTILDYIHLQSADTVMKNDQKFKVICEYDGGALGISYIATNYIEYTRFR